MSKRVLRIGTGEHGFSLPIDLVTSTQAILARKRSGKSYTASVQAEEMLAAGQQIGVIDPTGAWWGLRASADGKNAGFQIVVFGGRHADAPLEPRAGKAMAAAFVEHGFSAIFDIGSFTTEDQLWFVSDFCAELLRINRDAVHIFMDEADTFAPQTPRSVMDNKCLGTVSRLVKQGGIGGVGFTMITQRSASINWDVLSQIDLLAILRMSAPHDITPVFKWLESETSKEFAAEVKAALPSLPVGTAFFASAPLGIAKRVEVRTRKTFNSGATPKPGERRAEPKVLAKIDIAKLGEQIKNSVERAAAEDPKALRKRIGELEAELKKKLAAVAAAPAVVHKNADSEKVRMLTAQVKQLEKTAGAYDRQMGRILTMAGSLIQTGNQIREAVEQAQGAAKEAASEPLALPAPDSRPAPAVAHRAPAAPRAATVAPVSAGGPVGAIKGVALKVASIAAGYDGQPVKRAIMAAMCGVSDGGSFSARLSEAKTAGAIVIEGGCISATQEGIEAYAGRFQAPTTTDDVLAIWRPKLGTIQNKILDVLVGMGGESISVAALAEALGASAGGSFSARISEVRSTGLLVDTARGQLAANKEALFL